jgi:hypothetical protein
MAQSNDILLVDREEIERLTQRSITDDEWKAIKLSIAKDNNMWAVIDECMLTTIYEVLPNG